MLTNNQIKKSALKRAKEELLNATKIVTTKQKELLKSINDDIRLNIYSREGITGTIAHLDFKRTFNTYISVFCYYLDCKQDVDNLLSWEVDD